ANDGQADGPVITVALTVSSANDAPVSLNDSYSTPAGAALNLSAPQGVLSNDSDVDGDALSAILLQGPQHGTLGLNGDGSFQYTPAAGYSGADSFRYQTGDGTQTGTPVRVSLTVTPAQVDANQAPQAQSDAYRTAEDGTLTLPAAQGVLANDSDADGDALTARLIQGPQHGTLAFNPDGSFNYTPDADYHGPDSFRYQAGDGQAGSAPVRVALHISAANDAPTAQSDAYSSPEDGALSLAAAQGVLANDSDADGDRLTVQLIQGPRHGTLSFNPDGSFSYRPAADYHGPDSFRYQAGDGSASSRNVTVELSITPVNDLPQSLSSQVELEAGASYTYRLGDFPYTDADGDALQAIILSQIPREGRLTLNGQPVQAGQRIDAGAIAQGALHYTPLLSIQPQTQRLAYSVDDGQDRSAGYSHTLQIAALPSFTNAGQTVEFNGAVRVYSGDTDGARGTPATPPGAKITGITWNSAGNAWNPADSSAGFSSGDSVTLNLAVSSLSGQQTSLALPPEVLIDLIGDVRFDAVVATRDPSSGAARLPSWIHVDPKTGTITTDGSAARALTLQITAKDVLGHERVITIKVLPQAGKAAATEKTSALQRPAWDKGVLRTGSPFAKAAFSDQLRQAGHGRWSKDQATLLDSLAKVFGA
ncbi:MAG: tandem-95 repeat protein, partial [Methylococcaceae bacterium]